jgi:hypothetical protein
MAEPMMKGLPTIIADMKSSQEQIRAKMDAWLEEQRFAEKRWRPA